MTHFKKTLGIAALLTIGAVHAKQVGKKTTPTPSITAPTPTPVIPRTPKSQPTRAKTFIQLYNEVKHAKNAWDYKDQRLSDVFVKNLFNDAQAAAISRGQLDFLFVLARDCHAQFTGPKKDIDILRDLEDQRETVIKTF